MNVALYSTLQYSFIYFIVVVVYHLASFRATFIHRMMMFDPFVIDEHRIWVHFLYLTHTLIVLMFRYSIRFFASILCVDFSWIQNNMLIRLICFDISELMLLFYVFDISTYVRAKIAFVQFQMLANIFFLLETIKIRLKTIEKWQKKHTRQTITATIEIALRTRKRERGI